MNGLWKWLLKRLAVATAEDVERLRSRDVAIVRELDKAERTEVFSVCIADEAPAWHDFDREQLRVFFKSETGGRLRAAINFYEQGGNRRAVLTGDPKAIGRAAGFHDFGAWLVGLSADIRPQQDDHSTLTPGAREVAERYAP